MTTHRTNPHNGIDHQVLAHLSRIEDRALTADRIVVWALSLIAVALVGLIGVIVLPGPADLLELAPAALIEEAA